MFQRKVGSTGLGGEGSEMEIEEIYIRRGAEGEGMTWWQAFLWTFGAMNNEQSTKNEQSSKNEQTTMTKAEITLL